MTTAPAAARFGPRQVAIIILAVATALIHLSQALKAYGLGDMQTTVMFTLSALGYLGLLGAYYLPIGFFQSRRNLVRWVFIAFTAFLVIAWLAIGDKSWPSGAVGYLDKLIEVILLALLLTDKRPM